MSVWIVCPSARPPEEVAVWAKAWRERGYKIALFRDSYGDSTQYERFWRPGRGITDLFFAPCPEPLRELMFMWPYDGYPGYAKSINELIRQVIVTHDIAESPDIPEWFIAAGDDIFPDPNHTAEEIARECKQHFFQAFDKRQTEGTFGVMQPTGDRWGEDPNAANPKHRSAYIDRVCGSAWIGREFARRINQGRGPLWPEYFHMSVDRELQGVAQKYGVLWQRPDLTHFHQHWGRPKPGERIGHASNMPAFLKKANEGMTESERLCDQRERDGFLGSEPL